MYIQIVTNGAIILANGKVRFAKKRKKIWKTNYQKVSVGQEPIVELHDELNLTGAEISVNVLPALANEPFVYSHKQNEEIYCITEGKVVIDGEDVFVK